MKYSQYQGIFYVIISYIYRRKRFNILQLQLPHRMRMKHRLKKQLLYPDLSLHPVWHRWNDWSKVPMLFSHSICKLIRVWYSLLFTCALFRASPHPNNGTHGLSSSNFTSHVVRFTEATINNTCSTSLNPLSGWQALFILRLIFVTYYLFLRARISWIATAYRKCQLYLR